MTWEFPSFTPRRDARWNDLEYQQIAFDAWELDCYCDALRSLYAHGQVDFALFEATNRDDFLSAYHYDLRGPRVPIEILLSNDTVRQVFNGPLHYGSPESVEILDQGGCQFEGLLADVLLRGGAYTRWEASVEEAKTLAAGCVSAIRSISAASPWSPYVVLGPWCSYFHDMAWDYTFVVQLPYDARWFVMCATETD